MHFHLQKKLKRKTKKHRPRTECRKTKLCWQNERSEVKTGAFCSLNVLSQQRRRPPSECQLILLSPHQILYCFPISSTWLISDLPASPRRRPFIHSENFIRRDRRPSRCISSWPPLFDLGLRGLLTITQLNKKSVITFESHLDRKQSGQSLIVRSELKWAGNSIFLEAKQIFKNESQQLFHL